MQILVWQVAKPGSAFVLGGSWRVPVMHKLLDNGFINDLKSDGTYNDASFEREYESTWVGSVEDAFFNSEIFNKHRVLKQPEYEYSGLSSKKAYYIMSIDVGRIDCQTAIMIFKVTPQEHGVAIKTLVNLFAYEAEHFGEQAVRIKKLYYKYLPKCIVIDGAGMGVGLIDFMVKKTEDEKTGEIFPPFGVLNDDKGLYKNFKTDDMIPEIIYIIKADPQLNSDAYANVSSQISSGKVKFLLSDREAKEKLLTTAKGKTMNQEQRANYLKPFTLTSILGEEMMNLVEVHDHGILKLEPSNKRIKHDKFSAFAYGLYYIKQLEDKDRKKKKGRISDFMFYS